MKAIADFLSGIANAISAAIDFLIGFIEDIVFVVQMTGKFLLEIPSYFSWLPAPVLTIIVVAFGVVVMYKVMGREG